VEEPGASVTVSRRALVAPPRVVRTPVAPQYKTILKQVVADPGGVEEIPVPAEYSSVDVQHLVRPAEVYEVDVPPVMGEVETKVLVNPERYEALIPVQRQLMESPLIPAVAMSVMEHWQVATPRDMELNGLYRHIQDMTETRLSAIIKSEVHMGNVVTGALKFSKSLIPSPIPM